MEKHGTIYLLQHIQPPKYLICDKASQLFSKANNRFRAWCKRRGGAVRYGAAGKHGSIAVIERFIRSLKDEYLRCIPVAFRAVDFAQQLQTYRTWFNSERPHEYLRGCTPDEAYFDTLPKNKAPRYEPRPRYPEAAWCATPQAPVRGPPGATLQLALSFRGEAKTLPVIRLSRSA